MATTGKCKFFEAWLNTLKPGWIPKGDWKLDVKCGLNFACTVAIRLTVGYILNRHPGIKMVLNRDAHHPIRTGHGPPSYVPFRDAHFGIFFLTDNRRSLTDY